MVFSFPQLYIHKCQTVRLACYEQTETVDEGAAEIQRFEHDTSRQLQPVQFNWLLKHTNLAFAKYLKRIR